MASGTVLHVDPLVGLSFGEEVLTVVNAGEQRLRHAINVFISSHLCSDCRYDCPVVIDNGITKWPAYSIAYI